MIISIQKGADERQIRKVVEEVKEKGLSTNINWGEERTVIAVIGVVDYDEDFMSHLIALDGVEDVKLISAPYKLAAREYGNGSSIDVEAKINNKIVKVRFGGQEVVIIVGPCSIESYEQMDITVRCLKALGLKIIRGSAFKPRIAPRCFEGLGEKGLEILATMRSKYEVLTVNEIMDTSDAKLFNDYQVDVLQVGTRNMQNFRLLDMVGEMGKPVILKRGLCSTYKEWLLAAERILDRQKKKRVILCERGIRTFETYTRNTLDLNAVPVIKDLSWLPIIIDPSHGTGKAEYVPAVSKGALAAGADGLIIEAHPNPQEALTDGDQSLFLTALETLLGDLRKIAKAIGRKIA